LLASASLAVLMHAAVLGEVVLSGYELRDDEGRKRATPVRVRTVPGAPIAAVPVPLPPAEPPRAVPLPAAPAEAKPPRVEAGAPPRAAASDEAPAASVALANDKPASSPTPPSPAASEVAASRPPDVALGPTSAASASEGVELPVYETRLPPQITLRYGAKSGRMGGAAELVWQPTGGAYSASLTVSVMGIQALLWQSQGQIDAHGIAPDRFTDTRRRRGELAANFRRDSGRITYSGPTHEHPLYAGTQDRLTWLLQVPAIVAAAPQRFAAGSEIRLFVAGARGDADVWVLQVHGPDRIRVSDGREIAALRLSREAHTPYGTDAEVWLDPERHYLPVRARIGDQTLELLEMVLPP
jgi:hypothetical protein